MFNPILYYDSTANDEKCFETIWDTRIPVSGYTDKEVHVYIPSTNFQPLNIIWGDGTSDYISVFNSTKLRHSYALPGIYRIKIYGEIRFNVSKMPDRLIRIENFGELVLTPSTFYGASNMTADTAIGKPRFSEDIARAFQGCTSLKRIQGIKAWDTASVNSMWGLFYGCPLFDDDISSFNTSSVTNISYMFYGCANFKGYIGDWDVSKVTTMRSMMQGCSSYNKPLTNWRPESVTDLYNFFRDMPAMSPQNVDATVIAFANAIPNIQTGVSFPLTTMKRTVNSNAAANALRAAPYNWTVGGTIVSV